MSTESCQILNVNGSTPLAVLPAQSPMTSHHSCCAPAKKSSASHSLQAVDAEDSSAKNSVLKKLDYLGAGLSLACAVHCLLFPVLIMTLPLIGIAFIPEWLHHEASHHGDSLRGLEITLLVVALLLALMSLCWGTRVHRRGEILVVVLAASILFALAFFYAAPGTEAILVGTGGICLAVGHLINRRLCKSCKTC